MFDSLSPFKHSFILYLRDPIDQQLAVQKACEQFIFCATKCEINQPYNVITHYRFFDGVEFDRLHEIPSPIQPLLLHAQEA